MELGGSRRIAVIGSGVSGLGAAWALRRRHQVTLFESEDKLGGHANTVEIEDAGRTLAVDTGFIVYNDATYPNLIRLFQALGVEDRPSDMSFSVSVGNGAFEYRGSAAGLLAQPANALSLDYRRMVKDILRFQREARSILARDYDGSIADYLQQEAYSPAFINDFLLPMVGCIWSSSLEQMRSYPAKTLIGFLENHGLLQLRGRPEWKTVPGGSRTYVGRIARSIDDVRLNAPVLGISRDRDGVTLRTPTREDRFDHVVFATHADTTLSIMGADSTSHERQILGAFRFSKNRAVLHRDPSFMPARRRAWSSWNYRAERAELGGGNEGVSLTYWMNRLQGLRTQRPVFVTLNPTIEPRDSVAEFEYDHPIFDGEAVAAQSALPSIQGDRRTWFAGAWTGYGFHEDGLRSGLAVAAALGSGVPWAKDIPAWAERGGEPREVAARVASARVAA